MTKAKICFLDMDGVLADMVGEILRLRGLNFDDLYPKGQESPYAISRVLGLPTNEELWVDLKREFWANIPRTKEADELVEMAHSFFGVNNVFALSLVKPGVVGHECISGKSDWLKKHYGTLYERHVFATDKIACARSDAILIDDCNKNVDAFSRAGGRSIIFPRRWNRGYGDEDRSLAVVELLLRIYR